jgi:hypothetical protein
VGQTADQIKDEIEHQREQLGSNLQQLESKVKDTVDWRSQFEQRPMAGIGLAFGAGFLLSIMMPSGDDKSNSRSSDYRYDMANYRVQDDSYRSQASYQPSQAVGFQSSGQSYQQKPKSPEMNEISETVENIRGAVMGLAATRLRSFLAEAVPGFQDEYEQARTKRGASDMSKIDTELGSSSSTSTSTGSSNSELRDTPVGSSTSTPTYDATSPSQSGYRSS